MIRKSAEQKYLEHRRFEELSEIIKRCEALLLSKRIRVTLWTDNFFETQCGSCDGNFISQKILKHLIRKQLTKVRKEYAALKTHCSHSRR